MTDSSKFKTGDRVVINLPGNQNWEKWNGLTGTVVATEYKYEDRTWRAMIQPDEKRPDGYTSPFWWKEMELELQVSDVDIQEVYESLGVTTKPVRTAYAAWCENYLEDEDRPCGGIVVYQEDDQDAPCTSCGGRCGYLVADYLPGQTRGPGRMVQR